MWPKSFLNEPNNKSLDGGRGDKDASEKQEKFDFSEPFKISNKQQLSPLKANTSGMTKSLFGQLNYPIVVSPGGDMIFKFEKPPVRLNGGRLHRAVDSIVHDDTSISSQSTLTESSPSQSDSQIIFAVPINVVSTSFRRSSSPNKQLQSRDSSSNSILAALKSLGTKSNTKFSSIFIKPKTAKHIEQSAFYTKKEKDKMNVDDEKTSKNRKSSRSAFDNNKILGILPEEPKEIRLNESVEELLKRFSYEDSLFKMSQDQTTRSRPHLFTTSGAVVSSSSPNHQVTHLFNYRAKSKVKNVNNNDTIDWLLTNGQQSDKKSSSGSAITGSQFGLKWTCLVCLSKHLNYVNVCSICGSSKPDESISRNTTTPFATTSLPLSSTIQLAKSRYSNLNQSKSMLLKNHQQFSAYLLNRLGYSGLNFEQQHQQTTETPTTVSASTSFSTSVETNDKKITNPYLKKWTCRYCNFSNDSLKIVCLNCRWVKTCTTERSSNDSNLSSSKLIIARSSGDEFKHLQPSKKATEEVTQTETTPNLVDEEICCATCKTPIRETTKAEVTIVKTVIGDKEKVVEKTKESDKLEAEKGQAKEPSLSEIFNAGGGKKWKCTTCLVMNSDNIDKCSCCATSRPDLSTTSESSTVSVTVPTDKPKAFSLETTNNNTKPFLNPYQSSQLPPQTFSPSITQKPNDPTTKTTTESPLAGIFNNQNKWKCNTCLIMNDNDKIKCVACQTEKPDSNSKASKTTAAGFSLFTQTPLFPSSSVSAEGLTKKTTNDAVAPQSTPNITLPLPTPSTISTSISSTSLPSATSAQFKPSLGLPTSTTGFKIDFSSAFSNKDSTFKLPLPASATPSASTQATITPFNLAQTPSLGGADSFFGGFKAASSTTTSTTTASATPSFTLPSSINSGFSFNTNTQQNTNANSSAPAQVTFGFNPSNTTASLFGTTTATTSSRPPKDSQATTLSTTSAISTPNQLAPTISFGSMSTPTTTINTSTLGATSTILDKPSTEFNFQAGVNLLHANKRPNIDPIPNFSSNKTPNTNIGGTTFPSFNLSTSTPTSFMINTPPQTSAANLSNVPSGSFPSLLNPNSNSATTSFSTTTPTPISLFNSGSTFLSPSSTGSQSLSNNMFSNTGLTQQPKFNFSSTGFSMTPHINFTSTESPFKFSASNETHSTPATEVRKIRRATRRK